jgi:hypothetical protein
MKKIVLTLLIAATAVTLNAELDARARKQIRSLKEGRDDNDVTGDVLAKEFDLHFEVDKLGTDDEIPV